MPLGRADARSHLPDGQTEAQKAAAGPGSAAHEAWRPQQLRWAPGRGRAEGQLPHVTMFPVHRAQAHGLLMHPPCPCEKAR